MNGTPLELRPMGIGDIYDTGFRMYRNRFAVFLIIALAAYIPFGIVQVIFLQMAAAGEAGAVNPLVAFSGVLLLFLLMFIILPLCQGAMIHQISSSYLGEQIGAVESYRRALPRLVRLLIANILAGIIIMIGFVLLIVPGIIFSLWFLVITAVVMLEDTSATGSLGRSKDLMSGNLGKGFMVALVGGLIALGAGILGGIAADMLPAEALIARAAIDTFVSAAILPIQTAALILFYYDLRIRKEGFDLQQLSEQLDRSSAVADSGPPAPLAS